MSKSKDHQRYNFWDYAIKYKRNNQEELMEKEMAEYNFSYTRYTFSTLGKDGERYYPEYSLVGRVAGAGLNDYRWTKDIKKAMVWEEQEIVEMVAIEFENTEIIEIIGDGSKMYKVIKTME